MYMISIIVFPSDFSHCFYAQKFLLISNQIFTGIFFWNYLFAYYLAFCPRALSPVFVNKILLVYLFIVVDDCFHSGMVEQL